MQRAMVLIFKYIKIIFFIILKKVLMALNWKRSLPKIKNNFILLDIFTGDFSLIILVAFTGDRIVVYKIGGGLIFSYII